MVVFAKAVPSEAHGAAVTETPRNEGKHGDDGHQHPLSDFVGHRELVEVVGENDRELQRIAPETSSPSLASADWDT